MINPADLFSIAVGPSSATAPSQEVDDFDSIKLKFHLNDGDSVSFTTSGNGAAAPYIDGLASDVWLYNQQDAVRPDHLWQRYRIMPVDQVWSEDGDDVVTVTAVCYKQVVANRYIRSGPPTYSAIEQAQIIVGLINHTQTTGTNGSLGINTTGVASTGQPRDRLTYKIGDNIGQLITDLTKVINGPTWRVAPAASFDRQLYVKLPSAFAVKAQPMILGDNVVKLQRKAPAQFANSGFVPGTAATVGVWFDAASLAADPRGRWEATRSPSSSVTDQASINEAAQGLVAELSTPPATWQADMDVARWLGDSGYMPGDIVSLKKPATIVDTLGNETTTSVSMQVVETSLSVDGDGQTSVSVTGVEL